MLNKLTCLPEGLLQVNKLMLQSVPSFTVFKIFFRKSFGSQVLVESSKRDTEPVAESVAQKRK